jgi:hypothetical protein
MAKNIMVHALDVEEMIGLHFGSQVDILAQLEVVVVAFLAALPTGFSEVLRG